MNRQVKSRNLAELVVSGLGNQVSEERVSLRKRLKGREFDLGGTPGEPRVVPAAADALATGNQECVQMKRDAWSVS